MRFHDESQTWKKPSVEWRHPTVQQSQQHLRMWETEWAINRPVIWGLFIATIWWWLGFYKALVINITSSHRHNLFKFWPNAKTFDWGWPFDGRIPWDLLIFCYRFFTDFPGFFLFFSGILPPKTPTVRSRSFKVLSSTGRRCSWPSAPSPTEEARFLVWKSPTNCHRKSI